MKLTNEFEVATPLESTWHALLDVPMVARSLPGARIDSDAGDGLWRGTMKVKLGPVATEYEGRARLLDADEDERAISFHVEGLEVRGQGSAAATITNRLTGDSTSTRVVVETELHVTGRQAQLGQGLMEDVAAHVLGDFARRLEAELTGAGQSAPPPTGAADVLNIGAAAGGALRRRAAPVAVAFAAGLVLGVIWGRR